MDLLLWKMSAVSYRRNTMAQNCQHRRVFCPPGGRWQSDTEQVAAQWRLPGASSVSWDMLHWAMPRALLQHLRMAIKMACDGGTFARRHLLFP